MRDFNPLLLLLFCSCYLSAVGGVLYSWGAANGDTVACSAHITPGLNYPFLLTTTRGLPFFGVNYTNLYISPNGFVSDVAADGLSVRQFPMTSVTSQWPNCNNTNTVNCWIDYYYSSYSEWTQLSGSQNDSDPCVHGATVGPTHIDSLSQFQSSFGTYTPISDPGSCVVGVYPPRIDPNWMIAAYWADMEVVADPAVITYRETTDSGILSQAKLDIEQLPGVTSFTPGWAYVITWSEITFTVGYIYDAFPTNTFQMVLATDGTDTYAIFNYDKLEFGTGQPGFDAGDGIHYCSFVKSRTNDVTYLASDSNIATPGRWVLPLRAEFDNSSCEPLRTEVPSCNCDPGWEGRLCAVSIDDCLSNPCPSNSICVDGHLNFTCDFCQYLSCQNGGSCRYFQSVGLYKCVCLPQYIGQSCEILATAAKLTAFEISLDSYINGGSGSNSGNSATDNNTTAMTTTVESVLSLSTSAIAGVTTGGATALGLIGLAIILCLKCPKSGAVGKRTVKEKQVKFSENGDQLDREQTQEPNPSTTNDRKMSLYSVSAIQW